MEYHQKFIVTWGLTITIVFLIGVFGPEVLKRLWFELAVFISIALNHIIKPVYVAPGVTLEHDREHDKMNYYWYITGISVFVIVATGSVVIRTWIYYFGT